MGVKMCSSCRKSKPLDDFSRRTASSDGRQAYCKLCARDKKAQHYEANREREIERARNWNLEHPEQVRANDHRRNTTESRKEWKRANYREHRDENLARAKKYREKNGDEIARRVNRWRKANPERVNFNKAAWAKSHPEFTREFSRLKSARRRAVKRAAAAAPFTVEQLEARLAYYGFRCWLCGAPWEHLDHVKPLSKGGPHMLSNLRPACAGCNLKKGSHWPVDTSNRRGHRDSSDEVHQSRA